MYLNSQAKQLTILISSVSFTCFLIYLIFYQQTVVAMAQQTVEQHAKAYPIALKSKDNIIQQEYMKSAVEINNYQQLTILDHVGDVFLEIEGKKTDALDRILQSLKLMPVYELRSDINYLNEPIGSIKVLWPCPTIYHAFYIFLSITLIELFVLLIAYRIYFFQNPKASPLLAQELKKTKPSDNNQSISEFLEYMSYEIRTPMNAVLGFSQILKGIEKDPEKTKHIDKIHLAGVALLELVNDMLDFAKIESGNLELQYSAVSVQNLLIEFEAFFSQKVAEKGLQLTLKITCDPLPALVLDVSRLRQILFNLLNNAINNTEKGSISLTISSRNPRQSNGSIDLTIVVKDSGCGISKEDQQRVFDSFWQARGFKLIPQGSGLAISRRLLDLMGATIVVDSIEGLGSTFTIELPETEIAATSDFSPITEQENFHDIVFEAATVLIVDDVEINRELLAGFLAFHPLEIIYAENGHQGVEQAIKYHPDLILMDMKMPIMDGETASRILRDTEETRSIPIILVTALIPNKGEQEFLQFCDGYLNNPLSMADLNKMLIKFLPYHHSLKVSVESEATLPSIEEIGALPVAWRALIIELAETGYALKIKEQLDEIKQDFPATVKTIKIYLSAYRFDLIEELLSSTNELEKSKNSAFK